MDLDSLQQPHNAQSANRRREAYLGQYFLLAQYLFHVACGVGQGAGLLSCHQQITAASMSLYCTS